MPRWFLFIWLCCQAALCHAALEDTIAYKIAILHIRAERAEEMLLKNSLEPPSAVVSEFQWILDTLKQRCINPETAIADTIVETWTALRPYDPDRTLLEVARALSLTARNTVLFGVEKVNFRMTSKYWLARELSGKTSL